MMGNIKMVLKMGMVYIIILMEKDMKVYLLKVLEKEKVFFIGKMEVNGKDILKMMK